METQPQSSNLPIDLPAQAYRHLIHTLIALLPPPITDTPEATLARNHAAIARIADLAPVNAAEAELAAQCIAARAQAEDVLRLIRLHAADIGLVIKLNAQYAAMVRASLAAHNRLLRDQQQRRKRGEADNDEWTRHIAAEAMLSAIPLEPTVPLAPPVATPSKTGIKSHILKNETPKRRSWPPPATTASVSALLAAALRTPDLRSVEPSWPEVGAPRSNNGIERAAQQRSA
ncbi:MAG TPA: hypothetical protein DDZ81_16610 [Acetobacteraceae bacterium]|jgi:hypothetical protein|nr:hypothetical protein [Acetobacteraceae bacterium]